MKTKEQILRWLDKQPWKCEFYEAAVLSDRACKISYNTNLLILAFDWSTTKQGSNVWKKRNEEYQKWYNSPNNRPQSWEEYCKENPVKETDWFIDDSCQILPMEGNCARDNDTANIMSKEYCKAFVAYMKLFQLRNAWVQDFGGVLTYKLITIDDKLYIRSMDDTNGLSFPTGKMAEVFMEIFIDLLEVAKPLL